MLWRSSNFCHEDEKQVTQIYRGSFDVLGTKDGSGRDLKALFVSLLSLNRSLELQYKYTVPDDGSDSRDEDEAGVEDTSQCAPLPSHHNLPTTDTTSSTKGSSLTDSKGTNTSTTTSGVASAEEKLCHRIRELEAEVEYWKCLALKQADRGKDSLPTTSRVSCERE